MKKCFLKHPFGTGFIYFAILTLVLVACDAKDSKADSDNKTFIESVDEYNTFTIIKIVDRETGCKFFITNKNQNAGSTQPSAPIQILDKSGMPVCN